MGGDMVGRRAQAWATEGKEQSRGVGLAVPRDGYSRL